MQCNRWEGDGGVGLWPSKPMHEMCSNLLLGPDPMGWILYLWYTVNMIQGAERCDETLSW